MSVFSTYGIGQKNHDRLLRVQQHETRNEWRGVGGASVALRPQAATQSRIQNFTNGGSIRKPKAAFHLASAERNVGRGHKYLDARGGDVVYEGAAGGSETS